MTAQPRVVGIGPGGRASRAVDGNVVVYENGVETQLLGLRRRRDDGFGRRLKPKVIAVRAPARKTKLMIPPDGRIQRPNRMLRFAAGSKS